MSAPSSKLRLLTDAIEWREVDGEIVAIDVRKSTYIAANRTATTLWPALVKGTTAEALEDSLVERFGIAPSQAASEIDAFLSMLRDQDLLQ